MTKNKITIKKAYFAFDGFSEKDKNGATKSQITTLYSEIIEAVRRGGSYKVDKVVLNEKKDAYLLCSYDGIPFGMVSVANKMVNEGDVLVITDFDADGLYAYSLKERGVAEKVSEDLLKEAYKKAKLVGMKKEDAEKRICIMHNNFKMSDEEISKVIGFWKKPNKEIASYIPDTSKIIYQDTIDRHFYRVLGYTCSGMKALRLVGAMSTGKNVFIESLASLCYRPLLEVDMQRNTEGVDFIGDNVLSYKMVGEKYDKATMFKDFAQCKTSVSKLFDGPVSDELAAKLIGVDYAHKGERPVQCIEFVKQPLTLAMQYGGWINFNELNFAQPHVLSLLHRVLDTRASLHVPGLGEIKAHEDFVFMSTMNPPKAGYAGTNSMNEAFESRLTTVMLPPTDSIKDILNIKYPDADKGEIRVLNKIYKEVFKYVMNGELPEGFLALRRYENVLTAGGFGTFKDRIMDNLAYTTLNDEEAITFMKDSIIDKCVA